MKLYNKGILSFESNYYLNTAKFIFIGTKVMTRANYNELSFFFAYIGVFNVVMMNQIKNRLIMKTFSYYSEPLVIYSLRHYPDIDYVYQEKLTNLNGYTYEALAFRQKPRLYKLPNGEYHGNDIKFMKTIAEKQNAHFNITNYIKSSNQNIVFQIYNHDMSKRVVDMTINTAIKISDEYTSKILKSVNTFDINGYCAFVPYPQRSSFIGQLFTPYDFYTWIVFIITIGICVFLWKMFNLMGSGREDSALYFMYGIIASFLLQSIPFRNNRIIQRSLLQICIFMMFIIGNAYQSLIISLISESRYGATVKTFDELMQSNYSLKVDSLFYSLLNLTDDFSINIEKLRLIDTLVNDINYQEEAENNTAIVLRCDMADYIMHANEYDSHAIEYFYLLPDQIYTYYESFSLSRFSPYQEKLQYFSTLIFESGIRQHWKEFDKYDDIRLEMETNRINNEEYLINFDDLLGAFYLLGFGFICAILALLFEIFWHDCLRHLNNQMIIDFFSNKDENKVKTKGRKMKVRRVQVQPMQMIEEESSV